MRSLLDIFTPCLDGHCTRRKGLVVCGKQNNGYALCGRAIRLERQPGKAAAVKIACPTGLRDNPAGESASLREGFDELVKEGLALVK